MGYTPLVRWRNFTLENLKWVLNLYPDMQFNKSKQEVSNQIEENCKGYKKTIYQYGAQLGLESKEPVFKTQYYLYGFTDDNLNKYLEFWFKMYVCPNPYVSNKNNDKPISPFFCIGSEILESPDHKISYDDFCTRKFGDGKSNDIFRNALIAFGKPIELEGDVLYVKEENVDELKRLLDKVGKTLPMQNHNNPKEFFERFDYNNFINFYDLKTINEWKTNYDYGTIKLSDIFKKWMREQKRQDGSRRFTDHTINIYVDTINAAVKKFNLKSIFDITEKSEIEEICIQIRNHPEYDKFNKNRGNGALSAGLNAYSEFIDYLEIIKSNQSGLTFSDSENDEKIIFDYEEFKTDNKKYKRNLIVHGAPGTGKSYRIENLRKDLIGDESNYTRVTFHPDYTYSGFVGTYKPVPLENGENSEITYEYVPGPFMKILTEALMHQDIPYLLIIEEINRANTAAVFGDVFQLLDRDNTGKSQYPVNVSRDMKSYLKNITGIDFDEIRIPSNMFIWATMNSADQGVYPMDTAFKRRWSFSYIGLNDSEDEMKKYNVVLGAEVQQRVNWNKLRNALNDKLTILGINEDKLLGPFFISEHDMSDEIGFSEVFKDKIISYLFEDAARGKRNKLFTTSVMRYSEICRDFDLRGTEIFNFEDVNTDFSPVSELAGNK